MRYCGRPFETDEIEFIRGLLRQAPSLNRYRLSLKVCERLNWRRPDGRLKDMSCRVALARMQADGLIELPAPKWGKPVARGIEASLEAMIAEPKEPARIDLSHVQCEPVTSKPESRLWNAYIDRYHYLKHQP